MRVTWRNEPRLSFQMARVALCQRVGGCFTRPYRQDRTLRKLGYVRCRFCRSTHRPTR